MQQESHCAHGEPVLVLGRIITWLPGLQPLISQRQQEFVAVLGRHFQKRQASTTKLTYFQGKFAAAVSGCANF